jgi:hypothetical protein
VRLPEFILIHWSGTPAETCERKGSGVDAREVSNQTGQIYCDSGLRDSIEEVTCLRCRLYWTAKNGKGKLSGERQHANGFTET